MRWYGCDGGCGLNSPDVWRIRLGERNYLIFHKLLCKGKLRFYG